MTARLLGPAMTVAACAAIWAAYEHLSLLRGSVAWDLRYVLLAVAAVLLLSAAQWIVARLERR